jgi:hypothetical protein
MWTSNHDGCYAAGLGPGQPGDVDVTIADNGRTVTVPLGRHLRVQLDNGWYDPVWSDIDAGQALHRAYLDVQRPTSSAIFTALRAVDGEGVTAIGPGTWSVRVVVPAEPAADPAPAGTCTPRRLPSSYAGAVALTEADNGRTIQVARGDAVGVFFPGCRGFDFQPAIATAPLVRYRAHGANPGDASAVFATPSTGTATITATTDGPCFHSDPACLAAQQDWRVTINVFEACTLSGPATAQAGSTSTLAGRFKPGATVQIWFRPYGGTEFAVRRTLTADLAGNVATDFRSVVDQRWYATSDQGCTSAPGLTQISPYVTGPASVRRGDFVRVGVRGPAGAAVGVWFKQAGGQYTLRRTGRLDASGGYATSYIGDADYTYYAVTGPGRRTTTPVLTTVR